jgi:hypothetical protein
MNLVSACGGNQVRRERLPLGNWPFSVEAGKRTNVRFKSSGWLSTVRKPARKSGMAGAIPRRQVESWIL